MMGHAYLIGTNVMNILTAIMERMNYTVHLFVTLAQRVDTQLLRVDITFVLGHNVNAVCNMSMWKMLVV